MKIIRLFIIKIFGPIWYSFSLFVPKNKRYISINTFPDFDDTARSFISNNSCLGLITIVLTTLRTPIIPSWADHCNIIICYRYSLLGVWLYHRSKYVFFTHGLFSFWTTSPLQTIVNVWHGMPIKNIGLLDNKKKSDIPRFDLTIASNENFRRIISHAFGVEVSRVLICQHPRIDSLSLNAPIDNLNLPAHKRLSVWLPTYRSSKIGDIRIDGDARGDIFDSSLDFSDIDALFREKECICVVKPHPMANANRDVFTRYTNIVFVDDEQLNSVGVTLYQLLGNSDFLITDVSSIYFDYKAMGRPIIVYCPDFLSYKGSRGFVVPIDQLIEESVVTDRDNFLLNCHRILEESFVSDKRVFSATSRLLHKVGVI